MWGTAGSRPMFLLTYKPKGLIQYNHPCRVGKMSNVAILTPILPSDAICSSDGPTDHPAKPFLNVLSRWKRCWSLGLETKKNTVIPS